MWQEMGVEERVGTSLLLGLNKPSAVENLGQTHLGNVSGGQ